MAEGLRAGLFYFAIVYAAGFVFGTLRTLAFEPVMGPLAATLVEAPLMLAACYFAARYIVRWRALSTEIEARLAMGISALALLLLAEMLTAGPFRGWTVQQWLQHFLTPEGMLSLALFLIFAFIPLFLVRRSP